MFAGILCHFPHDTQSVGEPNRTVTKGSSEPVHHTDDPYLTVNRRHCNCVHPRELEDLKCVWTVANEDALDDDKLKGFSMLTILKLLNDKL